MNTCITRLLNLDNGYDADIWEGLNNIQKIPYLREPFWDRLISQNVLPRLCTSIYNSNIYALIIFCSMSQVENSNHLLQQNYIEESCQILEQIIKGAIFRTRMIQTIEMIIISWTNLLKSKETASLFIFSNIFNIADEIPQVTKPVIDTLLNFFNVLIKLCEVDEKIQLFCNTRIVYTICELMNKREMYITKHCIKILYQLMVDESCWNHFIQVIQQRNMLGLLDEAQQSLPNNQHLLYMLEQFV